MKNKYIVIIFTFLLICTTILGKSDKVTFEWIGHGSAIITTTNNKKILIDPWISTNPICPPKYKNIKNLVRVDFLVFTHGHVDHFMLPDAKAIIEMYNPKVIAPWELSFLVKKLIPKADVQTFKLGNPGAWAKFGELSFAMTFSNHSSGAQLTGLDKPDNLYTGNPVGYLIKLENNKVIYFTGDTGLTSDFKLVIGDYYKPDLAIVPIGGVFTLGPDEAAYAVKMMKVKKVIPIHYKTFPVLTQAPNQFKKALKKHYPTAKPYIINVGEAITVELK